jgi:hypothetical protein
VASESWKSETGNWKLVKQRNGNWKLEDGNWKPYMGTWMVAETGASVQG